MGRTLNVTVHSARDLLNADEVGETDAFVLICFDNKVEQELKRTETIQETTNPEWDESFEIDITSIMESTIEETGEEPKMLTFCVYDGDEGESEPLGVAGIDFSELVKTGKFEGDLEVFQGQGTIKVTVELKRVKIGSMLKESTALKVAGGVAGVAALGAVGAYLYKRYETKKEKLGDAEGDDANTGIAYGANVDDDDDDEEDRDAMKNWWEMDDEEEDDDDEQRWGEVDV